MTTFESEELREAFHAARRMSPEERGAYLAERLGDRPELIREVEQLVAADPEEEHSPLDGAIGAGLFEGLGRVTSLIPERVGPYRILDVLGEGGMGIVYLAEQESPLTRTVAVKVLRPGLDSQAFLTRFEHERQLLVFLDHPSIARVLDAGTTEDGRPFFAMEFVAGLPLHTHCERYQLGFRERIALFIQVCDAVQHAHEKGIIHRDLKPSNLLVSYKDGRAVPKVIDFGVAKALTWGGTKRSPVTLAGQMIGTPDYMAPEQADSAGRDVDTRSDVYALGVILYQLLTDTLPIDVKELDTDSWSEIVGLLQTKRPERPSASISPEAAFAGDELRRALERDLDWVVLKCLEKERSRRYASADALADDLRRFLDDRPISAGPPSRRYLARKFVRRHRSAVRFAAVLLLALLGGLAATTWQARRAEHERQRAEEEAASQRLILDVVTDLLSAVDPYRSEGFAPTNREVTVADVFERMNEQVGRRFESSPLDEATIRHTLGLGFLKLGRYDQALANLERSRELYQRVLPAGDRRIALAQAALGHAHCEIRGPGAGLALLEEGLARLRVLDPEAHTTVQAERWLVHAAWNTARGFGLAERRYELVRSLYGDRSHEAIQALLDVTIAQVPYDVEGAQAAHARLEKIVEEYYGSSDHPEAILLRGSYADFLQSVGRFSEARPLYEQTYADLKQSFGPDAPRTLRAASHLALMLAQLGEHEQALAVSAECVRLALGLAPVDSLLTLEVSLTRARCLIEAGRLKESEELLLRTEEICAETIGSEPANRIAFDFELSNVHLRAGQVDEAELLLLANLERTTEDPVHQSWDRARALECLVYLYIRTERIEPALRFAEEGMSILSETGVPAGSELFEFEVNLIHILIQGGDHAEARRRLTRLLALRRAGPSQPDLAQTLHFFSLLAYEEGNYEEAAGYLLEVQGYYDEWYDDDHEPSLLVRQQLASVRAEQGRHEEAVRMLRGVETVCRAKIAAGTSGLEPLLHATLSKMGRSLLALEQLEEAEAALDECLPSMHAWYGPESERVTVVLDALEEIYGSTGRPEAARGLRARFASR